MTSGVYPRTENQRKAASIVYRKIGLANKGRKMTMKQRKKLSQIRKKLFADGKIKPYAHWTGKKNPTSVILMKKLHESGLSGGFKKGHKPWNWTGRTMTESEKLKSSPEWSKWRKTVYQRDNYTCYGCDSNQNLNSHHIWSFAKYPEYRFEVWNGQTLCEPCHMNLHKELGFGG